MLTVYPISTHFSLGALPFYFQRARGERKTGESQHFDFRTGSFFALVEEGDWWAYGFIDWYSFRGREGAVSTQYCFFFVCLEIGRQFILTILFRALRVHQSARVRRVRIEERLSGE